MRPLDSSESQRPRHWPGHYKVHKPAASAVFEGRGEDDSVRRCFGGGLISLIPRSWPRFKDSDADSLSLRTYRDVKRDPIIIWQSVVAFAPRESEGAERWQYSLAIRFERAVHAEKGG